MKKILVALVFAICLSGALVNVGVCEVTIHIDQILQNISITGIVKGLPKGKEGDYRVVVYVHTDQWYIHPFAAGGEGDSWAAVKSNGTWKLKTKKRKFAANAIAALVVKADGYKEKTPVHDIADIPHIGEAILDEPQMRTKEFYNKL